jgi:lipopolysaccharide transport system ATP-binding protein
MRKADIQRRFEEIVDFAEVTQFLDTPVKFYSSGMYTRLAFAVAAHLEPEILVVDEVLAVGDAAFQKKCLGKMGAVASEGRTVVFVSHNMGAINRLCQSALWLDQGKLLDYGPTADVVAKYIASNSAENGVCVWPEGIAAKGIDEFRLFGMRILGRNDAITSTVDVRHPFVLSFDYEIRKTIPYCRIGFALATADGTVVFDSYDSDHESHQGRRDPGRHTLRCEIPGHLLLPGHYLLSFNAGMPGLKNLLWLENILTVVVEDTHMIGDVHARPMGIIRPRLKWERVAS